MKNTLLLFLSIITSSTFTQVIYTDISDEILTSTAADPSSTYDLDLNNDGTVDFSFEAEYETTGATFLQNVKILPNTSATVGNEVLESGGWAKKLNVGESINTSSTTWDPLVNDLVVTLYNFNVLFNGNWDTSPGDGYIGFKFLIGTNIHYGWARVNIIEGTYQMILKDYAYEATPGVEITIEPCDLNTAITQNGITLNSDATATGLSYQWLDCDDNMSPILGEINSSFIASQNGNYALQLSDGDCTSFSDCIAINSVGLDELDIAIDFYPNPTNDILNIRNNNQGQINIHMYDALGKSIINKSTENELTFIDLAKLKSGIYFVTVSNDKKMITKKILKQ